MLQFYLYSFHSGWRFCFKQCDHMLTLKVVQCFFSKSCPKWNNSSSHFLVWAVFQNILKSHQFFQFLQKNCQKLSNIALSGHTGLPSTILRSSTRTRFGFTLTPSVITSMRFKTLALPLAASSSPSQKQATLSLVWRSNALEAGVLY